MARRWTGKIERTASAAAARSRDVETGKRTRDGRRRHSPAFRLTIVSIFGSAGTERDELLVLRKYDLLLSDGRCPTARDALAEMAKATHIRH